MDNILAISHLIELQRAGLDVDELSDMDWSDRFDTLLYVGLNPMDYDYGFLDDYNDEPAVPAKQVKRTSFFDMMLNDAARVKKPVKPHIYALYSIIFLLVLAVLLFTNISGMKDKKEKK